VILHLLYLVLGLAGLAFLADLFVQGVAEVSARMRVSQVVTGALIIGFGTSAPELVVSTVSAMEEGAYGTSLAMGNIVGSNVANLTLVLAIPVLMFGSVDIEEGVLPQALLALAAVAVFAFFVCFPDPRQLWGVVLLFLSFLALCAVVKLGATFGGKQRAPRGDSAWIPWAQTTGGLVGTVVTAHVVVNAAIEIADDLAWSGGFVGFGLVAIGTSLPELVTALAAVRRDESGLVIGNLLGSNLFNSLMVGGSVFLVNGSRPYDVGGPLPRGWIVAMCAVSVLAVRFKFTDRKLEKSEAWGLLVAYGAFFTWIAFTGTMH